MKSFLRVTGADVFRGSRPETDDDFLQIRNLCKSVVSLEGTDEDQKEVLKLSPVPLFPWPISNWEIRWPGITVERLINIVTAIRKAPAPAFVHCKHGRDRTGLVIAAYRVTVQGWTKEGAMVEAIKLGYHEYLNIGLNKTWGKLQP